MVNNLKMLSNFRFLLIFKKFVMDKINIEVYFLLTVLMWI